ncbi:MAG: YicC/YloC family endoribonuclease [Nonlabens sp.]
MIVSMTGYGKALQQLASKKITVEIRALNSKNLDLNLRLPQSYRSQELPIRQQLSKKLLRGKVDVSLHIENTGVEGTNQLNLQLVESYMKQLAGLDGVLYENNGHKMKLLEIATSFPDVFKTEVDEVNENENATVLDVIHKAAAAMVVYRKEEGAVLEKEFQLRINNIDSLLEAIIQEDVSRLANVRTRLEKAVAELKDRVDENRFEQELIYYLEKYDITEEKVRLKNHLEYFKDTMGLDQSQGKKLGFIAQEIGREINTIGSKANDAAMQQLVVQMKDELEKIKEQLLNVL